jgi:hypothetical protein
MSDYLFDWPEYVEPAPVEYVPVITICADCGEASPNETLHKINHGTVFNGWCVKHLWMNRWALFAMADLDNAQAHWVEALEWIEGKGFTPSVTRIN